jgi:hypothetical protein
MCRRKRHKRQYVAQAVLQYLHGFAAQRAELLAHRFVGEERRLLIRLSKNAL